MKRSKPCQIITSLVADGWRSPDTYDQHFADIPKASGVYIILAIQLSPLEPDYMRTEIAYVGMSGNLAKRLAWTHEAIVYVHGRRLFAKRMFKGCEAAQLRSVELKLIRELKPTLNTMGTRRLRRG